MGMPMVNLLIHLTYLLFFSGAPGLPVATGVRGHHQSIVPLHGPSLSCLDHDFHLAGITPSVAFIAEIPSSVQESFFSGRINVTTKDKVFQPSSPMRHGQELLNILTANHMDEDNHFPSNMLFLYTDGGPDHRVTYSCVQISHVCLFLKCNLDMLVAVRCAPHQSWTNLAERCMSILNLALQNVALERRVTESEMEKLAQKASSMGDLREVGNPEFKQAFLDSMQPVIHLLNQRFSRMKLKGEKFVTHSAATESQILAYFSEIHQIDPTLSLGKLTQSDLKKSSSWNAFVKQHCKCSHYSFQVKKCLDTTCSYCSQNPPLMPDFESVYFLPDPIPTTDGTHYLSFEELYGQSTCDKHRPSLLAQGADKIADSEHRQLLVAGRVRDSLICSECTKPRCIYAASKLSVLEEREIARVKEENT